MSEKVKGHLLIIGGAEDKSGDSEILRDIVSMAGEADGRLMILTTATENPEEVGQMYRQVFTRLGVNEIDVLNIESRNQANNPECCRKIMEAAVIFFTGGDQLRITSILGGTGAYKALMDANLQGTAIAGTSAGASAMSSTMIVDGNSNDPARKCTLMMAPGLGLVEQVIIDQHFAQRGRIGRLLCGVAENPYILGIGIDEDTAIKVYPDAHFEVIGTNSVTVIDGRTITDSNVSELKPEELLCISNATLHVLTKGYGFDMKVRKVLKLH